jgi:hypothetical protein
MWIAWIVLVSAAGAAACSDANVAGNYTAQLTNRNDGCSLGLTAGDNSSASFIVTQSGSDVTLMVKDLPGLLIAGFLGSNTFTGGVDGNDVNLERKGTVKNTTGSCEYTFNAEIDASQDGDTMSGRVEYRAATNGTPDCGSRKDCVTVQDFNATRPPPAAQ